MNVTIEDLVFLLGQKEAELFAVRRENAQLRACLPNAPAARPANAPAEQTPEQP